MRIAAADDRVDLAALEPLLVQGAVEHWHFASAVLLLMTVCAYGVVVRARSGMGPLAAWHTLRHGVATSTNWALNRLLCWLGVLLLLMAGASGALMFYAPGLAPERAVARLHHWLAWSFPVFLLIHVSGQWLLGGLRQLLKILLPHRAHGRAAVTGGILAAVAGLAGWQVDQAMIPELSLVRVESAPDLDGVPEDPLWSLALPVAVHTVRGANLRGGESEVRVRGVHHDEHAYLLFEWEDPNRSHKFLPLQKTAMGWKLLQTSNGNHDENTYYEDK